MLLELLNGNISQEEYFLMNNIKLILKKLPKKIYGFVFNYKNYNYIVVNESSSLKKQRIAILHEIAHIELNHLQKQKIILEFKIEGLEDEADRYVSFLLDNMENWIYERIYD